MRTYCLDNSVVSDFLKGREYVREFVESVTPEASLVVPTLVCFESYVWAVRHDRQDVTLQRTAYLLDAFERTGFDEPQAREAAEIRGELLDEGAPIGAPDVLIAGVARSIGATVVTADDHYERVPLLDVELLAG